MNSLQLNAVLPTQTQGLNQIQTQKTESSSFAEILKAAQKNDDEKSLEVSQSKNQNQDKTARLEGENQKTQENLSDKKSVKTAQKDDSSNSQKSEKSGEKSSKDEKVAKKSDEKDGKNLKDNNFENQAVPLNLASQKIAKNEKITPKSEKTDGVKKSDKASKSQKTDASKINEKSLAWLKSEKVSGQNQAEEIPDGFAELIDAAVEFIPGSESESEKLENAQNLAISDPESFLAQVHALADAEIAQVEQKNQASFSDGKNEKAEESKSKKNRLSFDVHDLRTSKVQNAENADEKAVQKIAAKKEFEASAAQKSDSASQLTMELSGKPSADITSSSSQAAGASGSTFQSMLSASVQENAGEIVKAGNIVLKDNNQGSINLILKPEALGNVKISLNLNDKVISGQISVQSREAFEAFRENLDSLKQAFAESGFDTGNFDLNFSQQSFAQGGNSGSENPSASYFAEKTYGDFVALGDVKSSSEEAVFDSSGKDYSVNIVA